MTTLVFFKSSGHFLGFKCSGHSGYAEAGSDIVCAAVSASTQMCAAYLLSYYGDDVSYRDDAAEGVSELKCLKPFEEADKMLLILEGFAKSLATDYSDYFRYDFKEV